MKHFIHLSDFSKQEIVHIFELADKELYFTHWIY